MTQKHQNETVTVTPVTLTVTDIQPLKGPFPGHVQRGALLNTEHLYTIFVQ